MTHAFHAAYKSYLTAKQRYFTYDGEDDDVSNERYVDWERAKEVLMAVPLGRSGMRWALRVKIEILEEELGMAVQDGERNYPLCLPWLGYIKADMLSLKGETYPLKSAA